MSRLTMTRLEEAMLRQMKNIVTIEYRPFSYLDFETVEVDNHYRSVSHGTCRNKFSKFVKMGLIELQYNSKVSYYTLKGHSFGKGSMTPNHMGISSVTNVTSVIPVTSITGVEMDKLFGYLHTVPIEQTSVHDIHFKFTVIDIYKFMSRNPQFKKLIKPVSYDIVLNPELIDGLKIQPIIHRTDTVTVSVACSATPVPVSDAGILWLSCALTRLEERLSVKLDECGSNLDGGYEKIPIPDNRRWTVTMWHFGRDKKYEYCREGYSLTWGYGREVLRAYTKSIKNQQVERKERQEYPNKPVMAAINQKHHYGIKEMKT